MEGEEQPKPESTLPPFSDNPESRADSETNVSVNRPKALRARPLMRPGAKPKESRGFQREDQIVYERLALIKGPTTNLPPIKYVEKKFTGRSRLYIGNLPMKTSVEEIKMLFSQYGETDEIFIEQSKGFGFIRMDYPSNAERAKNELSRYNLQGKNLIIRNAYPAAIRIKNIPPFVSNELLHTAFSVFGEIEYAYVTVDERGKPTTEGVVEYCRKISAVAATKRCNEGNFFLTSSLKPVIVDVYEPPTDSTGFPEQMMKKTHEYYRAREAGPRFATPGSFEFSYAERWKEVIQKYKEKLASLKNEQFFEEEKLQAEMMSAQYDHETEQLKDMLRAREMDRNRFKQDWENRQRQLEEQCLRERNKFSNDQGDRMQDNLFTQASQLNNLLDREEQQLQEQWRRAEYSTNGQWSNSTGNQRDQNYRPMSKRPRH